MSEALSGEPIGLDQIDETRWRLHYGMLPLGTLDNARTARRAARAHRAHQQRNITKHKPEKRYLVSSV